MICREGVRHCTYAPSPPPLYSARGTDQTADCVGALARYYNVDPGATIFAKVTSALHFHQPAAAALRCLFFFDR